MLVFIYSISISNWNNPGMIVNMEALESTNCGTSTKLDVKDASLSGIGKIIELNSNGTDSIQFMWVEWLKHPIV